MADEAVLRIKLEEAAKTAPPSEGSAPAVPDVQQPPAFSQYMMPASQAEMARRVFEHQMRADPNWKPVLYPNRYQGPNRQIKPNDPASTQPAEVRPTEDAATVAARRAMERDQQRMREREARLELDPDFRRREEEKQARKDDIEERRRDRERDKRDKENERERRRRDREHEQQWNKAKREFDRLNLEQEREERRKQQEEVKQQREAEQEYKRKRREQLEFERAEAKWDAGERRLRAEEEKKRIKAEAEADRKRREAEKADPEFQARKKREGEVRRAKEDDAYKRLYGDQDQKSGFDTLLQVITKLRGTIGGLAGTAIGAGLDIVANFRQLSEQRKKEERQQQLLIEGRATEPPPIPQPSSPRAEPPPAPRVEPSITPQSGSPSIFPSEGANATASSTQAANLPATNSAQTVSPVQAANLPAVTTDAVPPPPLPSSTTTTAAAAPQPGPNNQATIPADQITKLGASAAEVGSKMASVVPVVGAVATAFGAAVGVIEGVIAGINKTTERLAEYSPEIAQAQNEVEVRRMMNDIRRARENGQELAEFLKIQAKMQEAWEEIKTKILTRIAAVLTQIAQVVTMGLLNLEDQNQNEEGDPTSLILGPPGQRAAPVAPEAPVIERPNGQGGAAVPAAPVIG